MGNIAVDTPSLASWPLDLRMPPDAAEKLFEAMNLSGMGAAAPDRYLKMGRLALTGAAIHAGSGGVIAWTNPETTDILIINAYLVITTVSTGACSLDVGTTPTSATTTSDNIFDGIDATATVPAIYSMRNASLDSAANVEAKVLASGKWVTIDEKTGDATGLVGTLFIEYVLV
jgi:hypothetical protein